MINYVRHRFGKDLLHLVGGGAGLLRPTLNFLRRKDLAHLQLAAALPFYAALCGRTLARARPRSRRWSPDMRAAAPRSTPRSAISRSPKPTRPSATGRRSWRRSAAAGSPRPNWSAGRGGGRADRPPVTRSVTRPRRAAASAEPHQRCQPQPRCQPQGWPQPQPARQPQPQPQPGPHPQPRCQPQG